jgi:hypothetical protein
MGGRVIAVVLALLLLLLLPRAAGAEPQPWAAGVTEAQKARAQERLDAGNRKFVERDYAAALTTYRDAAVAWDHPAIRFNIVRCLIQLDRPLEAYDNLKLALAYGAAPLEEAVYAEALTYEKLLAKQIGELEVRCEQPGAKLTLDGRPLATCPGTVTRRVAPGAHQVVGVRDGYLTHTLEVVVVGGERRSVAVALTPLSEVNVVTRRWRPWVPWLVFGGGLAVVGIGGLVEAKAASDMDAYDRNVATSCGRGGCAGDALAPLLAQKRSAELEDRIGVGMLAAGIAATSAGAVMLYLNRPRSRFPERIAPAVAVRPAPGGAVLALGGRF